MIAAVDHRHRTTLLAEVYLAIVAFHVEVAIYEHRPTSESAPERLLSVEVEVAVAIESGAVQGIVSTLEVATVVDTLSGSVQRV